MNINQRSVTIILFLIVILLSACTPSESRIQTAIADTQAAIDSLALPPTQTPANSPTPLQTNTPTPIPPTATNAPTLGPTATSQPLPTTVPLADLILLNSGFIHRAEKDSVDTCMAVGCKYYDSIADGITVYTFPDTDALILWISNSGDQYATQEITLTHVITQMFGEDVNTWIFNHLAASASANQEGYVDGRDISIQFVPLGTKLTMIGIGPAGK